MSKSYTKKPITIEAIKFDGDIKEVLKFTGGKYKSFEDGEIIMRVNVGDYVVKDIKGEFYPCKPDIFEASYDCNEKSNSEVGETSAPPIGLKPRSIFIDDRINEIIDAINRNRGYRLNIEWVTELKNLLHVQKINNVI